MLPVVIKRQRSNRIDSKQLLRAHVDQLPLDKQREFVIEAFKLLSARPSLGKTEGTSGSPQFLHEVEPVLEI